MALLLTSKCFCEVSVLRILDAAHDKSSSGRSVLARHATKRHPAIQQSADKFTAHDIIMNTIRQHVCALGALSVLLSAAQTLRALRTLLLTVALRSTTPFQDAPGQATDFSRHEQVSQIRTKANNFSRHERVSETRFARVRPSETCQDWPTTVLGTSASLRDTCCADAPGQTNDFSRRARQMTHAAKVSDVCAETRLARESP